MEIKQHKDYFEVKIPKMLSIEYISTPYGTMDVDYIHSKAFFLLYDDFPSGQVKHAEWVKKVKFPYENVVINDSINPPKENA